jgi:hypothetical protein
LGVRFTTSPCKKKFVENLLKKTLEEAKAHIWAVAPHDDDDDVREQLCYDAVHVD